MEIRVLGCSGGIGTGRSTTSFLIDKQVLIDAGSGVNDLARQEMGEIKHIFLTHSHLDHVHAIPLLIDSIFDLIDEPILIHALPATIKALREHIFNNIIWPDFTKLPHPDKPALRFEEMKPGDTITVAGNSYRMVPVNHIVPTVGYIVEADSGVFAFSGDTTTNDTLWPALNSCKRLDLLIVETAFSNSERELCRVARHYCPETLAADLTKLEHTPPIYLTHAKPGEEEQIFRECSELINGRELHSLAGGEVLNI